LTEPVLVFFFQLFKPVLFSRGESERGEEATLWLYVYIKRDIDIYKLFKYHIYSKRGREGGFGRFELILLLIKYVQSIYLLGLGHPSLPSPQPLTCAKKKASLWQNPNLQRQIPRGGGGRKTKVEDCRIRAKKERKEKKEEKEKERVKKWLTTPKKFQEWVGWLVISFRIW
jgi:hypothetical protein